MRSPTLVLAPVLAAGCAGGSDPSDAPVEYTADTAVLELAVPR